jgi:hypothetical protein
LTPTTTIAQQFDAYAAWRQAFVPRLRGLSDWLRGQDLLDPAVLERLQRIETRVRADKVTVAFVAEFSRGKSELINALFFAEFKRRIMPATAGRTTMCPTELGYQEGVAPSLRLLPIQSRLEATSLMDLRLMPERWTAFALELDNPERLAATFERVAEVIHVSVDEARELGFWHDDRVQDNPPVDADGLVEIPKWRHAIINFAHPLLKQGLTILDTPGLNAIGAEPELTVSLIPQAQAVLFILAADTGVTKSDLSIWHEHLVSEGREARLVVLNKIDTMWDDLSTPTQIQQAIAKQRQSTAQTLALQPDQVLAVSAQKALVAKVNGDADLLRRSNLSELEVALGQGLIGQRAHILRNTIATGLNELQLETQRLMGMRKRDHAEQIAELRSLRGKNGAVIRHMRERVVQEHKEFDASMLRIHAVRSVHVKLLREVFGLLSSNTLRAELAHLNQTLRQSGIKLGATKVYGDTFERLRAGLRRAQDCSVEIHSMLAGTFKQLNAEYGFSLQSPNVPRLEDFAAELDAVERSHQQYLGVGNLFRLAQPQFVERLVRALATRLRVVFESAQSELEVWNKAAAAQLDTQLRERRKTFEKRIDAIDRIQEAATGLDGRIEQIDRSVAELDRLEADLSARVDDLLSGATPGAMSNGVAHRSAVAA